MTNPKLLRVPDNFRTVEELLGTVSKMGLKECVVIGVHEDESLVFLGTDQLTVADANWLLDRVKNWLQEEVSD